MDIGSQFSGLIRRLTTQLVSLRDISSLTSHSTKNCN